MSYEFIKLSEVEKVETSYNANLLIEENGEIKRLSTENINFGGSGNQVQADWNETDDTSPAFIANKPATPTAVTLYYATGSILGLNGANQTVQQVKEIWESGAIIRFRPYYSATQDSLVLSMTFNESSGSMSGTLYCLDDAGSIAQKYFY